MIVNNRKYKFSIALLLCLLQVAGIDLYAQQQIAAIDSLMVDSLELVNKRELEKLEPVVVTEATLDSIVPETPVAIAKEVWTPNPTRATWLAVIFPGGGQIYNRKYWKLPIFYGGFAGCAYALSWNNNMYKDYSKAYMDIMDKDPSTNSYYDLLSSSIVVDENTDTRYGPLLKRQKDYYRRFRDISVFAFIGVYLLSIIDAYVDAELSNFDITPDISMRVEPAVIGNTTYYSDKNRSSAGGMNNKLMVGGLKNNAVGLQCSIRF